MNREIKFRAWNRDRNKFVEDSELKHYAITFDGKIINFDSSGYDYIEHFDVVRYTGLKDKNGVAIYEGDVVECEQMQGLGKFKGIVHYSENLRKSEVANPPHMNPDPRFYLDTRPWSFGGLGSEHCVFHYNPEVIGNIYENPDLLK